MRNILIVLIFAVLGAKSQTLTPAPTQSKKYMIFAQTLHVGNGNIIKNATIRFENGIIIAIDTNAKTENISDHVAINAKHVYPGIIAPNTRIGLNEIDAVRSTRDYNEVGSNNANIRSIIAYNADSKIIPTIRSNGVLIAQISPSGGRISGNSSIVQLDAWNWEDAVVKTDDALHINWPRMYMQHGWWAEPGEIEKLQIEKDLNEIEEIFINALNYCNTKNEIVNLKYEAFREVFKGNKKVYVYADEPREIICAVQFFKKFNICPVICGAKQSYLITDFLKQNNISVILINTHYLPSLPEEDIDMPYKLPKILADSGLKFCIASDGAWEQRNLPFQAGTAVAYGLSTEQALMAITKNTAEIMGIDKKYGTIEKGKSATFVISEGDILDMKTSIITDAFIDGRKIDLDNNQNQLYKKYIKKYFGE